MKQNKLFGALFALLSISSCSREQTISNQVEKTYVSVNVSDTKVAMGDKTSGQYPLTWQTSDMVVFNGETVSDPLDAAYNGKASATFSTSASISYPLTVIYPETVTAGGDKINIPAEQAYKPSKLANGYGIMAAYAIGTGNLQMNHLCGYVKIPIKGSATLSRLVLRSCGKEQLAGPFTVDFSKMTMSPVTESASYTASAAISLTMNQALSATATDFYFAVPASMHFASGFEVLAYDTDGKCMKKGFASSGKTFAAGTVSELPAFDYVPGTVSDMGFELSSTECNFPARGCTSQEVSVFANDEQVSISSSDIAWLGCKLPESLAANQILKLNLIPATSNLCDRREGTITFTGLTSKTVKTLSVSQASFLTASGYGFPARWEIDASDFGTTASPTTTGKTWMNEGFVPATLDAGKNKSYMIAASTTGNVLNYTITSKGCPAVGNLDDGDFIEFVAPVENVKAGTDFDLMLTLNANSNAIPKYWVLEYFDGGEWKSGSTPYTAPEDGKTKYSFYLMDPASSCYKTVILSFTLDNAVNSDFIRARIRAVGKINGAGGTLKPTANALVYIAPLTYVGAVFTAYPDVDKKDDKRIMQIGNSFTYYFATAFMLKEICRQEGHQTDVRINVKGSQSFEDHLNLVQYSQDVIKEGNYDASILQDGSYYHSEYGYGSTSILQDVDIRYQPSEILANCKAMTAEVRKHSPNADIILESPWSYSYKTTGRYIGFGSYEKFDKYQWKGTTEIAAADPNVNWISPIGKAWTNARNNYGFGSTYRYLNYTDNFHPDRTGAYLKACVNYLVLYGQKFGSTPADCGLSSTDAAKLRKAAEDIVLNGREQFHIR